MSRAVGGGARELGAVDAVLQSLQNLFSGARFAALRLVSYTAFGHIHARTRKLICGRYLKPKCAREGLAETLGRGLVRAKAVREARRPTGQRGALGTNVAGCALPHT